MDIKPSRTVQSLSYSINKNLMQTDRKHIVILADTFIPERNSASVQLFDLSKEFANQGFKTTVIIPDHNLIESIEVSLIQNLTLIRVKSLPTKDINYVRRTLNEFLMPFIMFYRLKSSSIEINNMDGIVWYSPSIFHAPLVKRLKKINNCNAYLILRDIFPEWAYDMGLMRKGLPYYFFKLNSSFQYSVANIIGVQSPGNLDYFKNWKRKSNKRLEVLNNWLSMEAGNNCPISIDNTVLAGRKIFVYAGNMGVAQGMDIILDLAERLNNNDELGFVFVGRGSELPRLIDRVTHKKLQNVLFYDEIDPTEIPGLYAQCHVGIIALDARHKSHNIPGKFVTYIKHGLPVLANINKGNDLAEIIKKENIGSVCESNDVNDLHRLTLDLLSKIKLDNEYQNRCKNLFIQQYTSESAVMKIVNSLFNFNQN